MAKRSKALPAAMAIEPSITAPVPAVPEEMHNDPEFWRTQAKMAKLDGRVTLANEAELAAKRAERRTGKAAAIEAENPIEANAERQVVQAAAEREARKPRTPQVAPLNGMAALGVAPAAVETLIAAEPPAEEVQSPSPEAPIAAEVPSGDLERRDNGPVMTSSSDGISSAPDAEPGPTPETPKSGKPTRKGRRKAAIEAGSDIPVPPGPRVEPEAPNPVEPPTPIVVASVEESLKAGDSVDGEGLPGGSMTILAVATGDAPEPSPVLANGLTAEEEATYQALVARRKPELKSLTVKPGSITDRILAMLKDAGGHSVQEISDAMGWNKPSGQIIKVIRAAPFPVTTTKGADGRNRYTAG